MPTCRQAGMHELIYVITVQNSCLFVSTTGLESVCKETKNHLVKSVSVCKFILQTNINTKMSRKIIPTSIVFFLLLQSSFNLAAVSPPQRAPVYEILIVQQAWHTGIIIAVEDIPESIWPEKERYSQHKKIDVSWGDEKFYQANGRPIGLAIRAILWPTQSVIRVFPFNNPVQSAYGEDARIKSLFLSENEFHALCHFISESFIRNKNGNIRLSTVNTNNRYYFLAKRKYHLFRTCNTWVALALKKSGLNTRSCCILNANQLFRQLKKGVLQPEHLFGN